ncbi:MAG: RagB/SusD family nutrient uptake outer membrane protein [Chitinophagaceae bacterium]
MRLILIIALLLSLLNNSCSKYLDEKRSAADAVPTTIKDLQALLDDVTNMNQGDGGLDEASADDYFLTQTTFNSAAIIDIARQTYLWQKPVYNYPNDYNDLYFPVYNSNLSLEVLENINRNSNNSSDWDNVKGSALFYRAYSFLRLAWTFSKSYDSTTANTDLGIPLKTSSNFNISSTRASVKDTYEKIISDLKDAALLLPTIPSHVIRPSKLAAYGALARTYLSIRKYDSAYKYADLALKIKSALLDYSDTNKYLSSSTLPFTRYNDEVIFHSANFKGNSMSFALILPFFATIDSTLYNSYNSNDRRKELYFGLSTTGPFYKGMYSGSVNNPFTGIAVDEIILIKSESQTRLGNFNSGLDDLNTLLIKRYKKGTFVPYIASSIEEALEIILSERRKELIYRDLRWADIKRLNKEGRNIIPKRIMGNQNYTLSPNDDKYALPLPNDVINLSGMTQNP